VELTRVDLAIAFDFARSEPAPVRNAAGAIVTAAVNVARFDYDATGKSLGLLVGPGFELGGQDRIALDALVLPVELVEGESAEREATVLHHFTPPGGSSVRRAYYSRDAKRAVDALLRQEGHHRQIVVVPGFLRLRGATVRYRHRDWTATGTIAVGDTILTDGAGRPLILSGAEFFNA